MVRRLGLLFITILCIAIPFGSVAQAATTMTDAQRKALGRGVLYFDTEEDKSCTTSDDTVSTAATGDHPKDAYNFFVANGFTPEQSAGIVGNLQQESTVEINPTLLNSSNHYGIAQWGGGRYTALKSFAASKGKDKSDFQLQLDFIIHELNTSESAAKKAVKAATTVEDAATAWNDIYERSGDTPAPRIKFAQAIFATYGGSDIGAITGSGVSACASTTSPDCQTATGNAKILCQAQAYNGIYYKWGGGHSGLAAFTKSCPDLTNPPNNQPSGGSDSHGGNPSPCGVDCSGLVSLAVSAAFGVNKTWIVDSMQQDTTNWKEIPIKNVQSGDVVTVGSDHVEIVDHYDPTTRKLYVFGAHHTGTKTGSIITTLSDWTGGAYRYIGTGGAE